MAKTSVKNPLDITKTFTLVSKRADAPAWIEKWFVDKKVWQPLDFVFLASDESKLDAKISKPCKADPWKVDVDEPSVEVSIRKF